MRRQGDGNGHQPCPAGRTGPGALGHQQELPGKVIGRLLAEAVSRLAQREVEDVVASGRHEFVRELVEFRVFRILIREGGDEAIRERAGRMAELFGRACQAGVGTQRFQGGGAAQQVAVAPRPAILLRVGPPGHPPPEGGAVRPLDEHPHSGRGQLGGNGHVHRGDRVEVGLARPESVQRIGVRVVGDEDRLQGGATSRALATDSSTIWSCRPAGCDMANLR